MTIRASRPALTPRAQGRAASGHPLRSAAVPILLTALLLGGCSGMGGMGMGGMKEKAMSMTGMDQMGLPEAVRVPAGNTVALKTVGKGTIDYECRPDAKMGGMPMWTFVGPKADLMDESGKVIGKYFGPPATWQAMDGSAVTGKQLAVAPAGDGNIPYQLVQANPATGMGAMSGTTYIQRTNLKGGAAPATGCSASSVGSRTTVNYQADYIFWTAAKKM